MKKTIMAIFTAMLCFFAAALTAFAEASDKEAAPENYNRTLEFYVPHDYDEMILNVTWEHLNVTPSIVLKNPDGDNVKAKFNTSTGYREANLKNVKEGYWEITLGAKKDLGAVSVSGGNEDDVFSTSSQGSSNGGINSPEIKSFEATVDGNKVNFTWEVNKDAIGSDYYIRTNTGYYGDTVCDGLIRKISGSNSANISNAEPGYYTYVLSYYKDGETYEKSIAQPVLIKGDTSVPKLAKVKSGTVDGRGYIKWDDITHDSYRVYVYNSDGSTLLYSDYVSGGVYSFDLPEEKNVKVFVKAYDGYEGSDFDVFDIKYGEPSGNVVMPSAGAAKNDAASITFSGEAGIKCGVYVDGKEALTDAELGTYELKLEDGTHSIVSYIEDGNGNMKTFEGRVTTDITPPEINLECPQQNTTTAGVFLLNGTVEPETTLYINGVETQTTGGKLSSSFKLNDGANTFVITAYDAAGNKTVKQVLVTRTSKSGSGYLIYIIPAVLFIGLTVWYIYLNKTAKKGKQNEEG